MEISGISNERLKCNHTDKRGYLTTSQLHNILNSTLLLYRQDCAHQWNEVLYFLDLFGASVNRGEKILNSRSIESIEVARSLNWTIRSLNTSTIHVINNPFILYINMGNY